MSPAARLIITLLEIEERPVKEIATLTGWSVALVAGYVNTVFRDIQHLTDIAFQVLFYLTPVMYPPDVMARSDMSRATDLGLSS